MLRRVTKSLRSPRALRPLCAAADLALVSGLDGILAGLMTGGGAHGNQAWHAAVLPSATPLVVSAAVHWKSCQRIGGPIVLSNLPQALGMLFRRFFGAEDQSVMKKARNGKK